MISFECEKTILLDMVSSVYLKGNCLLGVISSLCDRKHLRVVMQLSLKYLRKISSVFERRKEEAPWQYWCVFISEVLPAAPLPSRLPRKRRCRIAKISAQYLKYDRFHKTNLRSLKIAQRHKRTLSLFSS
jgi:hypothetical protein